MINAWYRQSGTWLGRWKKDGAFLTLCFKATGWVNRSCAWSRRRFVLIVSLFSYLIFDGTVYRWRFMNLGEVYRSLSFLHAIERFYLVSPFVSLIPTWSGLESPSAPHPFPYARRPWLGVVNLQVLERRFGSLRISDLEHLGSSPGTNRDCEQAQGTRGPPEADELINSTGYRRIPRSTCGWQY